MTVTDSEFLDKLKSDSGVLQLSTLSIAQLEALLLELFAAKAEVVEVLSNIKVQLEMHAAVVADGEKPDINWRHRAKAAKLHKGREDQQLANQIKLVKRRLHELKSTDALRRGNFHTAFYHAAVRVLSAEMFDRVCLEARSDIEEAQADA